jgi:Ni,Fe-hydrogenase I small subunit
MIAVAAGDSHGRRMQPKGERISEHKPAIEEVHILWITGGLGCDGDSVSITAASQPSLEDVMLGAIPGLPKVHLHNPVLAYTVGDEFMAPFHKVPFPMRRSAVTATGRPMVPTPRPATRSPFPNGWTA